jgi:hypothetical protein
MNSFIFFKTADTRAVDNTLQKQKHIEVHKVNEFCVPADMSKETNMETFQPKLCAFTVSQTVLDILPSLQVCSESSTFMKFWTAECQNDKSHSPNLDDVVPQIWTAAKKRFKIYFESLKNSLFKTYEYRRNMECQYKKVVVFIANYLCFCVCSVCVHTCVCY